MAISHYAKAKESLEKADIVINPDLGVIEPLMKQIIIRFTMKEKKQQPCKLPIFKFLKNKKV